ncbi:MAG: RagB/SusD family nutrient uptake outer membrane protein, partial [Bacteroidota bacterium]|nr:RagB/SusD family nutrient uptake outer membrane protein [Bacteroidota bacterium]
MKLKLFIIILIIATFISCRKELLNPVPQTSISDIVAFQTPERTLSAVNGMYAGVKEGRFLGGRYYNYQDARGEEFINETANGVTNLQTWNFTVSSSTNEVQNLWAWGYQAINRINVVIAGVATAPISDSLKRQYQAEARFLRALSYHSLVTIYARPYTDGNGNKPGIILYTEPQLSQGENNKERATVAEVYNLILEDLNYAEANLPASHGSAALNVTRAHKNAAIALKTRVYLHMGRYADVITEANKIVSTAAPFKATTGVQHELSANIASVFGAGGQTPENIFSFPFSTLDLPGTQNSLNQYYSPGGTAGSGNGDYSLNTGASGILSNTGWTATDARRSFNQVTSGKTYLRKWTSNTDYVPVIRYAEVLLNLAEALARTNAGVDARALALVNAVRKRSDPATTLVAATQADLINLILTERRIELLGEGFRSRDLMRLQMTLPAKGTAPAVTTNDNQYVW